MQCSFYYNSESIDDIICLISSMVRVYIYEILNFQELVEKRCMGGSKACMPIWMFLVAHAYSVQLFQDLFYIE